MEKVPGKNGVHLNQQKFLYYLFFKKNVHLDKSCR